jgi:hypothetical protein
LYRARRWNDAKEMAKAIIEHKPGLLDDYYNMMIERIEYLQKNDPGLDWDGVYRATSK